jgi:DNA-binding CsgD family transcriptional regulator
MTMAGPQPKVLTRREQQVIALIALGLDSREIARSLGIAYFTVRKHRSNILDKLDLSSAAQLAAYAAAAGPSASDRVSWPPGPP